MSKTQPLPVIFLKAIKRGDTRTQDLLGANPVLMPDTHLELRTRKDGVSQMYHVSNAAPDALAPKQAPGLGLDLGAPAAPTDPLAGIAATDPRRESIQTLATWDAPRAQRAAALLAAMTRNDLGAIGRLYGAMTLKEAEAASLDVGFGVPRVRSKQELLTYLHPQMMEAIRQRQAPKATAEAKEPPKLKRVTAQKDSPAPLTDSAIGSSLKVERGGVSQAPQAGVSPMNTTDPRGLDKPETYQADPVLATLARRLAERDFAARPAGSISRGDLKREYLEGKHANEVAAALDEEAAKAGKAKVAAEAIVAPPGYQVTPGAAVITIKGPFDDGLHASIKRAGGQWDREIKGWRLPADKAASLKRIMANFAKRAPSAEEVVARAMAETRKEIVRWLGYVEEKAPSGYLYQKGVDKLKELGIDKHPDLQQRLEKAMAQVRAVKQAEADAKAAAQQARAAEAARTDKVFLNVPYEQREMAKRHGARWDNDRRSWYVTGEVPKALQPYAGPPEAKLRVLLPVRMMAPLGVPVRLKDRVVVFTGAGKVVRIHEDDPSVHGSHLLGHEGERGAFGYYRPATEEETAAMEAQERAAQAAHEAKAKIQRVLLDLKNAFRRLGERPIAADGQQISVDGERLLDTQNIYGGGDWWVIQPDAIWYVQNNGTDGGNWDNNNVRTGGAGAIGWRLPYDPAIVEQLRAAQRGEVPAVVPKVVSIARGD